MKSGALADAVVENDGRINTTNRIYISIYALLVSLVDTCNQNSIFKIDAIKTPDPDGSKARWQSTGQSREA
jgi:hypothetical protein